MAYTRFSLPTGVIIQQPRSAWARSPSNRSFAIHRPTVPHDLRNSSNNLSDASLFPTSHLDAFSRVESTVQSLPARPSTLFPDFSVFKPSQLLSMIPATMNPLLHSGLPSTWAPIIAPSRLGLTRPAICPLSPVYSANPSLIPQHSLLITSPAR